MKERYYRGFIYYSDGKAQHYTYWKGQRYDFYNMSNLYSFLNRILANGDIPQEYM